MWQSFVHPEFQLNGSSLKFDEIIEKAKHWFDSTNEEEQLIGKFLMDWFNPESTIEISTSGTTGISKKILISKQSMVNSALATGEFFNLHEGNSTLLCLSSAYIAGKMMWIRAFVLGLHLDIVPPSTTPLAHNSKPYDFVAMVPLQVEASISDIVNIKILIIGGASINDSLRSKLEKLPNAIYETFGMSETITHIAARKIGETAFNTLPNVQIQQDENGCLQIYAPKLNPNWIPTNDLVRIESPSQFQFLGRIDNVINSGGVKIIPEPLENKLVSKINRLFFIGALPHEKLGQQVVLFIEGEEYPISEMIFEGFSAYEIPKKIVFVPIFDTTLSGKIKRKEIILRVEI